MDTLQRVTWATIKANRNRLLVESDWTQLHDTVLSSEERAAWCRRYVEVEVYRRKVLIFAAVANYDQVELIEMIAEARDYRISGNATAARYPLAGALATARGVTHQSILTAWGNALQTAYAQLAALIHRQEQAETAINNTTTLLELRGVMATILEALV